MAKKLIKDYVFSPGQGLDDNLRPDAYSLILQNKVFLQAEIVAYIQNQVDAGNPDYLLYTYSEAKCLRDSGYVIDALLFDLRYGGNEETRRVSSFYWNEDVPQIDGSRIPEYEAYQFLRDLVNTYILTNTLDTSPEQEAATQVIDETKTTESGTTTLVTALLDDVVSVIENGLTSLPDLEVGLGRIEILGKVGLEELLLITNTTNNTVIYNFAEPTKGGTVTFREGNSEAYPRAEQVNNGTTVINFKYNTSAMASSDAMQVFLENNELKVRPYDFGTDALERMRVGLPQAMLDADFEYGLQPTKWQAIGTMRGYPSTYEVPASDMSVVNVTTDASAGTSGTGASLLTVTTVTPHGMEAGDPFTIRALSASVTGFNRAEGTFLIYSVPSSYTFTYYSKSKVGTSNGQTVATANTQLRKARFYTGSSVGVPTFDVADSGSLGDFTTPLIVPTGSTIMAFEGTAPPNGAPLSGTGIAEGTQVSGTNGTGGSVGLFFVKYPVTSGDTSISLTSLAGVSENMAIADDAGDSSTPSQVIITSIDGDTLTLNNSVNANYSGDITSYTGIVINSGQYIQGTGTGASFRVVVNSDTYTNVEVLDGGSGYFAGDTLVISGTDVGGTSPANDLYLNVRRTTTDTAEDSSIIGAVFEVEIIAGAGNGTGAFDFITGNQGSNTQAANGQATITRNGGSYSISITNNGTGFNDGNRFLIPGTFMGGETPDHDAIVTVSGSGSISAASITGTAIRGDTIDVFSTVNLSQATDEEIPIGETISYSSISTIEVAFETNHGLVPGATVMISIASDNGVNNHSLCSGPFFVSEVPALDTIRFICRSPGTVDISTDPIDGIVYIRPDAFFSHRPFDGGVQLGTGGPQHGAQAIRQSKKYIRYQSGKGAMYNTGALFAPSYDIRSATAAGTTTGSLITVATDDSDHGLQAGARIRITGIKTVGYDGDYTVNEILDERTFKITAQTALGSTTAVIGPQCQVATLNWHGSVVRSGPFDDQNGIFFQYNGRELAVVRRTATFQIAGTIAIQKEKNLVTGTNTRFIDQLKEGDRIVIKGMTHVVTNIASNTSMTVTPDFRGVVDVSGAKTAKVEDLVIPQSEWNLDRCDGTGPSGYNIDITKMQMIGIQYSWYGAGFIDWMFRGPDGNYVFCHRLKGNNLNTEAYMRTGNLPVRYEVTNESANGRLAASMDSSQPTMTLHDVYDFPNTGTVYVDNELIRFTGRNTTTNQLTGLTRAASLSNFAAGSTRTYTAGSAASHNAEQGVVLVSNTTSPLISHWGSAYLIDGRFDEDRGYIFSYAETGLTVSTTRQTAFLLRLAPSVSNAIIGDLGERELLNRAQLLLKGIEITSDTGTGAIIIEGIINPENYPTSPELVGWSGLSGLSQGGQPSFAQVASGGSVNWSAGGSSTTATITAQTAMTTTGVTRNRQTNSASSSIRIVWAGGSNPISTKGIATGDSISASGIQSGTTITSISSPFTDGNTGETVVQMGLSLSTTGNISGGTTINFGRGGNLVNRNYGYFTKASVEAAAVVTGTPIDSSQVTPAFPGSSTVSSILNKTFGTTEYYEIYFNNSYTGTLTAGSGTVVLLFEQPPYAQPGETVFSFVAQPGQPASLDLNELKELTNTTIGGRGSFPNGPDVLAINVYRTSGDDVEANIVLRWGEAQA